MKFGLIFDVGSDDVTRKFVVNVADQDSSIIGEEAFMQPVSTKETTMGYFSARDFGTYRLDYGIRYDDISRSGSVSHHDEDHAEDEEGELEYYNQDLSTLSYAINFDQDFSQNLSVNLGLSSFERAPDDPIFGTCVQVHVAQVVSPQAVLAHWICTNSYSLNQNRIFRLPDKPIQF